MAGDELKVTLVLMFLALVLYAATWLIEGSPYAYDDAEPAAAVAGR